MLPFLASAPALAGPDFLSSLTGRPDCKSDTFCHTVWLWTGQDERWGWVASSSEWLLVKPFRILLILIVALVVRWVLHRIIKRVTQARNSSSTPTLLRPFKEKVDAQLRESGVLSERRRQRAATLGSVLRNLASAVVFGIAALMILSELGLDLAPLLASAGIAGVALGFGAQTLVKDVIAGMFMLLEDQYGVGDLVDVGEVYGWVEAVGLRITTIRDYPGVIWYVRNGEMLRVGNISQSWATVIIDVPIGFGGDVDEAVDAMERCVDGMDSEEEWNGSLLEQPVVMGVQEITVNGAVVRMTAKASSDGQWALARELRRRITIALDNVGISAQLERRYMMQSPRDGK